MNMKLFEKYKVLKVSCSAIDNNNFTAFPSLKNKQPNSYFFDFHQNKVLSDLYPLGCWLLPSIDHLLLGVGL